MYVVIPAKNPGQIQFLKNKNYIEALLFAVPLISSQSDISKLVLCKAPPKLKWHNFIELSKQILYF